jgi:hypothetical protein
MVQFKEFH